jgi:glyoxylase-like metal-dependent hydrolase (beta-lactamase superfamily II)
VDDEVQLSAGVERLLALDLATVYPGHGRPFSWGQFRVAYGRQRRTP